MCEIVEIERASQQDNSKKYKLHTYECFSSSTFWKTGFPPGTYVYEFQLTKINKLREILKHIFDNTSLHEMKLTRNKTYNHPCSIGDLD